MNKKLLLSTVLWCPEDQPLRLQTIQKHLDTFKTYEGDWDLFIVVNGENKSLEDIVRKLTLELKPKHDVKIRLNIENQGWSHGRNSSIKYFMDNPEYSLLVMIDGDVWVERTDWLAEVERGSKQLNAFMCRMDEPQYKVGEKKIGGVSWWLYDELIGMINVVNRKVIEAVGGYNFKDLAKLWGHSDPLWGRSLCKCGFFKLIGANISNHNAGPYPSLHGLGVKEEHNKEYDESMQSLKDEVCAKYSSIFWQLNNEILSGQRSPYFDYNYAQDNKYFELYYDAPRRKFR